jgi:hypothetical protein
MTTQIAELTEIAELTDTADTSTAAGRRGGPARLFGSVSAFTSARIPRTAKRTGLVFAIVAALFLGFIQSASAATWGYGGYNYWYWNGCQIRAGAVYDPYSANGVFDVYGGGQLAACSARHNYEVFVQEQYSPNNRNWYNIGAQVHTGEYVNAYGMSANNIAVTGPACGNEYWRTAVDVWADGYWSGWVYSTSHPANATRC